MADKIHICRILVMPEQKRPPGIPTNGWENNTEVDLKEIRSESVDWIHLAQDRGGAVFVSSCDCLL
jgi:hypothetical protein